ncbi:hypothetical protein [Pleionea mediterranea]|uniref:hypothetical protein n=1 Tax=Pleionea mediterranea TaxID=523701 RepID=UPI0011B298A2|nr:hypothetical protein [Pleionea mediterranea]
MKLTKKLKIATNWSCYFDNGIQIQSGIITDINAKEQIDPCILEQATRYQPAEALNYVAARHLAQSTLAANGYKGQYVSVKDAKGRPTWPEGYTGSISHKFNIAVVGTKKCYGAESFGIDLEVFQHLDSDTWDFYTNKVEIGNYCRLGVSRNQASNLAFSAKEAIYKAVCQVTEFDALKLKHITLKMASTYDNVLQGFINYKKMDIQVTQHYDDLFILSVVRLKAPMN